LWSTRSLKSAAQPGFSAEVASVHSATPRKLVNRLRQTPAGHTPGYLRPSRKVASSVAFLIPSCACRRRTARWVENVRAERGERSLISKHPKSGAGPVICKFVRQTATERQQPRLGSWR
jgi:hypothetical protein